MLKDNQTDAELAEYLRLWRAYKPTFGALGELFSVFGASVEVRAISDAESQSVVPVSDTRLAFYLRITGIDFSRPLSLSEAVEIARRATPLGSRPFAYYAIPSRITVPCGPAPEPAFVFVENNVVAELPPMGYIVLNSETGAILGAAKGHELETVPIPACTIASPGMVSVPIPARVLESPEMVVYVAPPGPSYDDVTGSIGSITLPTAHAGQYAGATFDSLRYYAKGTISNTGYRYSAFGISTTFYYATLTWEDSSLGDLSDKITIADPNDMNASRTMQTVFRIIFITYGNIAGYSPYYNGSQYLLGNQISAYSYNNGTHQITFWCSDRPPWYSETYAGRIQFRYLDGVTKFENLNATELVSISSGTLSKDTTTDRYDMYNAWGGDITLHAEY
jgi:hypothetical protein